MAQLTMTNMHLEFLSYTNTVERLSRLLFLTIFFIAFVPRADAQDQEEHLKRSLDTIPIVDTEISTETAHYQPMFGVGDDHSDLVKGVQRFGHLTIDPKGSSKRVNYGREELIYYVLEGEGTLRYAEQEHAIQKDDFFYLPIDTEHGFSNARSNPLRMMVMGFKVPEDVAVAPTAELKLANANEAPFQILSKGHGPTSSYRLLLGTTKSERDRLAAAYQVNSLYIIDFEPGGTNKVHQHETEEEIYFMLQGYGEMVAGEAGEERRYPVKQGDTFFFSRDSPVGFFSGTQKGEEHAQILAVRSVYPPSK